ncbi:reverse transcriptase domain-containing protein [Tanacetum coccineum]
MRKDHFPLPFIDQMLERLSGNEYYCFLDGFSGFFQIPIALKDQEKITFTCPYGTFAYRRMLFGLYNAPTTFQRCTTEIFHDMVEDFMEVFMDDFSVFNNSFDQCLDNLDKFLVDVKKPTFNMKHDMESYPAATTSSCLEAKHDIGGGPRRQETVGDPIAQTRFENVSKLFNDPLLLRVQDDAEMFDVNTLTGDEVFAEQEVAAKDVNLTIDEVTLAQALAALKSVKPKDKGKGIMVEEPVKTIKKKDLIRLDEETTKRLQAEFDEEERLAREKDEASVALIEEWDDIQAKIEADHELA